MGTMMPNDAPHGMQLTGRAIRGELKLGEAFIDLPRPRSSLQLLLGSLKDSLESLCHKVHLVPLALNCCSLCFDN